MSWRQIFHVFGAILMGSSAALALPSAWAIVEQEWTSLLAFLVTLALGCVIGAGMRRWGRAHVREDLLRREALVIVALSWTAIPVLMSLPYLIDGVFQSPADAIFETVSGFSTTGATVLDDIEGSLSRSMHIWRVMTHWLGGMGIMVLFVAVLPSLGVGGKMMFRNEGIGPVADTLTPRVREQSILLWALYIGMTVVFTGLLFVVGGLGFHDAIAHAMSGVSTGGFSTKNESIAAFDSAVVDGIVTVMMLAGSINFALYYFVVTGRWRSLMQDLEARVFLAIILVCTVVVAVSISSIHGSIGASIRYGVFQVVAIITGAGFATDDFDAYPAGARNILFMLMFIGGCAGSTSGGVKVFRFIVLARVAIAQIHHTFRPQVVVAVKVGRRRISDDVVRTTLTFFFAYLAVFAIGTLVMTTMTPDLETAMSATIASLGNVGPGLAAVGPEENYGFISAPGKIFLSILMIVGRLEIYTILVILVPEFWRR